MAKSNSQYPSGIQLWFAFDFYLIDKLESYAYLIQMDNWAFVRYLVAVLSFASVEVPEEI